MRALIRNANDSLALRFSAGVLLSMALAMAVFYAVMRPSPNEFGLMAAFLSVTAVISAGAGYTAYRLGWLDHAPSLRWGVLGGYGLSSLLTFINVWLTARLMFANTHDLQLATILLLFAGGIGLALGGFLSSALAARLQRLEQAAGRLAAGELDARVEIPGRDEIARLGQAFNQMAAQLQEAQTRQRELDALRRDLIAWVSHDLQTPLASVRAVVEALADGVVEDPATTQRYLETAQKDIRALSRLIDDLFQMAQLDAGGFTLNCEAGSLADLVSDTLESFSALAQRQGVRLNGSVPPEADPLWWTRRASGGCWPTWRPTPCATPRPAGRWRSPPGCRVGRWWCVSATAAKGSPPRICRAFLSVSTAARGPARREPAGPGWVWPSPAASSRRTAGGSAPRTGRAAGHVSGSACREARFHPRLRPLSPRQRADPLPAGAKADRWPSLYPPAPFPLPGGEGKGSNRDHFWRFFR
jgi:signal transduction histidine kinase